MTPDRLKNRIRFSTTLNQSTLDALKAYSDATMIPISKVVDVAIASYIREKAGEPMTPPQDITYSASD